MQDHFRKAKSLYSSTTNSFGTGEAVTITPSSVVGLPTDTEIVLTFDRQVTGKLERILGTVVGSNFVVSSGGRGYDGTTEQAHTSPVVEYIPNAADINDHVDGILVEHNQDGTHDDTVVTLNASTQTLTNKRITKRTGSVASSATPTINTDNVDMFLITALAVDITSMTTNLSGTPTEGQTLWIAITGTATRAIDWGAGFENGAVELPTSTDGTTRLDVGFVWNSVTSKWRAMAKG